MTSSNRISWRRHSGLAAVLCLAVFTGACSKNKDDIAKGPECPRIGVLADAARLVQFANAQAGQSDIVFSANMVNAAASCDYSRKHVDMALAVQVHAIRGPAGGAGIYPSRYFVAVVDAHDRILARDTFNLPITFENTKTQTVLRDTIDEVRIPVESEEAGATYQVIVGFELTPDQVIYNRMAGRIAPQTPPVPATVPEDSAAGDTAGEDSEGGTASEDSGGDGTENPDDEAAGEDSERETVSEDSAGDGTENPDDEAGGESASGEGATQEGT